MIPLLMTTISNSDRRLLWIVKGDGFGIFDGNFDGVLSGSAPPAITDYGVA